MTIWVCGSLPLMASMSTSFSVLAVKGRLTGALLLSLAFCLSPLSKLQAEDSPQYRGLRSDGRSTESNWSHQWGATGPTVQWRYELGVGYSGIVTKRGVVVAMGNRSGKVQVVAVELESGKELWKFEFESPLDANDFEGGPTATPLLDNDSVYVLSRRGRCFSLALNSGALNWELDLPQDTGIRVPGWGFSGAPKAFGSRLILNVGDAGVCLDKNTGEILWASEDRDSGYSSAVPFKLGQTHTVILGSARSYVCVEIESGRERWRQRWLTTFGCNAADAIVSGQKVFLSSGYSRGSALLDLKSGAPEIIWKHKDFRNHLSTSVLVDGFLYGVNGDIDEGARLTCMDFDTGEIRWSDPTFDAGALIEAGNRLLVLSADGDLIVGGVDPKRFEVLARHKILAGRCWVAPVLTDGMLLCRDAGGELVCVNLRPTSSNPLK